jgi:hypothetical protein
MKDFDAFAEEETGGGRASESRRLRSTIVALRQALEDAEAQRNAGRQEARAAFEGELVELRSTVAARVMRSNNLNGSAPQ